MAANRHRSGAAGGSSVVASIRDARVGDCPAATDLCLRSKASWGYDAAFMEQSRGALTVTPARLAGWCVRVAEDRDAGLVGVSAVSIGAPAEAELELLFVEPAVMGAGVGRALMRDVVARLRARDVTALWILSDPGAEPFYLRHGAVRVGLRPSDAIAGRLLPWLRLDLGGPGQGR